MSKEYQYAPVLRWKKAEEDALQNMATPHRDGILPIRRLGAYDVEQYSIVKEITIDEAFLRLVHQRAERLSAIWGDRTVLVDNTNLGILNRAIDEGDMLSTVLRSGRDFDSTMIPVTTLDPNISFREHLAVNLAMDGRGVAIRIPINDLFYKNFNPSLKAFLTGLELEREQVDLILDYGHMQDFDGWPTLKLAVSKIFGINQWRSLVFIGGSFPRDLTGADIKLGRNNIARNEWIYWSRAILSSENSFRLPTFGDFSIQSPSYRRPPPVPNVSASIRYAAGRYWIVMRGEGHNEKNKGNGRYSAQYCANAQLLVGLDEFDGPDFCAGDRYIYEKQYDFDHPGNATTWLSAGVNHHIVKTLHNIAELVEGVVAEGFDVS